MNRQTVTHSALSMIKIVLPLVILLSFVDMATKLAAQNFLSTGPFGPASPVLSLHLIYHYFPGYMNTIGWMALVHFGPLLMIALVFCCRPSRLINLAVAAGLAGCIGNLGETLLRGSITDFIAFRFDPVHLYVFNVADVLVQILLPLLLIAGVTIRVLMTIYERQRTRANGQPQRRGGLVLLQAVFVPPSEPVTPASSGPLTRGSMESGQTGQILRAPLES